MNEAFKKHWDDDNRYERFDHVPSAKDMCLAAFEAATPQWESMESAPKDRTFITVYISKNKCSYCVYWDSELGEWLVSGANSCLGYQPTHWQPKPEPPKQ